ncbi:hypothetical protein ONZ43_g1005 [Nemania bipapillata]|uniref:Uncharacterized protein n=1 Tax=Nemania bipapillata TaxID=110536 RepID=A0ACC2J6F0_9PEZI|nr:hypothetical protein ONZ43_g1005 [Nemania bipapillata]
MDPSLVFGSLHAEFNCMPIAIQDAEAWFADVRELSTISNTKEEFEAALRKRRDERFAQISAAWRNTKTKLVSNPWLWDSQHLDKNNQQGSFAQLSRNFSYDCILAHFSNYLPEHHRPLEDEAWGIPLSPITVTSLPRTTFQPPWTRQPLGTSHLLREPEAPRPAERPEHREKREQIERRVAMLVHQAQLERGGQLQEPVGMPVIQEQLDRRVAMLMQQKAQLDRRDQLERREQLKKREQLEKRVEMPVKQEQPREQEQPKEPEQADELEQPRPDSALSASAPASASASAPDSRQEGIARSSKEPGRRGRIEKPHLKRRVGRWNTRQVLGRSARVQRRKERSSP